MFPLLFPILAGNYDGSYLGEIIQCVECNAFVNPAWKICLICGEPQNGNPCECPSLESDNVPEATFLSGSPQRAIQKDMAVRLYRERGWVQIYSGYLGASIYLVKNESIQTPDTGITRYTASEVMILAGLTTEEIRTMHEVKAIFGEE